MYESFCIVYSTPYDEVKHQQKHHSTIRIYVLCFNNSPHAIQKTSYSVSMDAKLIMFKLPADDFMYNLRIFVITGWDPIWIKEEWMCAHRVNYNVDMYNY